MSEFDDRFDNFEKNFKNITDQQKLATKWGIVFSGILIVGFLYIVIRVLGHFGI